MKYIDTLLQGASVEWKPLGEVTELKRGRVISKEYLYENAGEYPVYSSQTVNNGEIGKIKTFDFDQEAITWTTDGANAGTVFYREGRFSITNVCGLIKIRETEILNYKFLYYWLSIEAKKYVYSGMGNPKLMSNQIAKIPIPLPSISVQREIVRILDKFTTLETELETELEAELEARKKQYEYYRDSLLKFDNKAEVGWKTLGEITIKIYSGGTPKTECPEYWENGTIPWMSSGEVNLGIIYQTEKFITEKGLLNSSAKFVPENSLVIALAGQGKTRGKVARTRIKLTTNQSLAALTFDNNKVNADYVYHYMVTQYEKLRQISSGNGTRGGLNLQMISTFSIPIPYPNDTKKSLEEQARIVAILDRFDTLVNSISEGLPKEIALRRKQYEYYRDQLLSFPKT